MDPAAGYVTDLGYVKTYTRELAPSIQQMAMCVAGKRSSPLAPAFSKVELGCGYGLSLLMDAASHPQASFIGVDINPVHTNWASALARDAGLSNITFLDRAFSDDLASVLPELDFIGMHGVWSWICQSNRTAILDLIQQLLKAQGIVMVSYNSLPGWSVKRALRELLMRKFLSLKGSTESRIMSSLAFARTCRDLKAPLFATYPVLSAELDQIATMPLSYIAHEYFNLDWTNYYQYEVAESFCEIGLEFAASGQILDNSEPLSFAKASIELLDQVAPAERETLKDVLLNRSFRFDLYASPAPSQPWGELAKTLMASHFLSVTTDVGVIQRYVTPDAERWTLPPSTFQAILACLAGPPKSGADILTEFATRSPAPEHLLRALVLLLGCGAISVTLDPRHEVKRAECAAKINMAVIKRTLQGEKLLHLLSPIDGLAYDVSVQDQIFLAANLMGKDPISYSHRAIKGGSAGLVVNGATITDDAEIVREIERRYGEFQSKVAPLLSRLGILQGRVH
jgi:hypothetical protein